jgi:hypothetical protein
MSITGNVILGLIYVLPGILFVFGLTRLFSPKEPSPFDGQISTGIALAIPAALLMHVIWLGIAHLLALWPGLPKPQVSDALTLLLGDSRSNPTTDAIASAARHWFWIGAYFLTLFVFSFSTGKFANTRLKARRRADWFDLLSKKADMIWLTTDMEIGGVAYLFAGMLHDFKLSPDGELERVVLLGTVRRTLKRPSEQDMAVADENYQDGGWVPIPGEYVVLKMSATNTVNLDYWYLEEDAADETAEPDATGSDSPTQGTGASSTNANTPPQDAPLEPAKGDR